VPANTTYAARQMEQDGGSLVGKWIWEEFQALPRTELTVDIHCVTKWSKRQCTALG